MTSPALIDITHLTGELSAAATATGPFDGLRTTLGQKEATERLRSSSAAADDLLAAVEEAIDTTGAVIVSGTPVDNDIALVLIGSSVGEVVPCEGTGGVLVDHLTPDAAGAARQRAQNQRSEMGMHSDASSDPEPADVLGLACLANEGTGGESLLLGAADVVRILEEEARLDLLAQLRDTRFPFVHPQRPDSAPTLAPILYSDGSAYRIRFRQENLDAGFAQGSGIDPAAAEDTVASLRAVIERVPKTQFRLAEGHYLLFDNTRFLHGRTEIDPDARRMLKRTYIRRHARHRPLLDLPPLV